MNPTLEQLKALGVRELSVKNQEATAVNPYDTIDSFGHEWHVFEDLALPPLPTSGIPDGTVLIEQVEEGIRQYRNKRLPQALWHDYRNDNYYTWEHLQENTDAWETRFVLVEKQESAKPKQTGMDKLTIHRYQAKTIENALRMAMNVFESHNKAKETAMDRELLRAEKFIKETLSK